MEGSHEIETDICLIIFIERMSSVSRCVLLQNGKLWEIILQKELDRFAGLLTC